MQALGSSDLVTSAPRRIWRPTTAATCFLLAAALRVAWAVLLGRRHPDLTQFPDSMSYLDPARTLLDSGRLDAAADRAGRPMLLRTPGYPAFIAVVQWLFGRSIVPVLALQGLLGGLVAPIVLDLSRRLGATAKWAAAAGVAAALDPLTIVASGYVLTEVLAQLTLVAAVWLLVRLVDDQVWRLAAGAGTVLAGSLLIRPSVYYLLPLLVLLVAWVLRRAERRRALVAAFALPLVVATGGWHARNLAVADFPSFSAVEHINLGLWRGVGVHRMADDPAADVRVLQAEAAQEAGRRAGSRSVDPDLLLRGLAPDDVDQATYFREVRALGVERLRTHPALAVRGTMDGLAVVAVDVDETRLGLSPWTTGRYVEWILQGGLVLLYAAALGGGVVLIRRRSRALVLLATPVVYIYGLSSGPDSVGRYRLPVLPLLLPLAAVGLAALRDWDVRRHSPPRPISASPGARA